MAECRFCSAPVDRRKGFCDYCDSRVELDLHGGLEYRLYEPESERICPHCDIPLATIDLKIDKKFLIEKCTKCSGLFFDPGELEMLMERSVSNVFHINEEKLSKIQTQNFQARGKEFKYVKCPSCRTMMNRRAFGYKSGVIVDHCNKHGYWLDEGELRQLQEWKKAGGELQQKSVEERSVKERHYEVKYNPESLGNQRIITSENRSVFSKELNRDVGIMDIFSFLLD